MTIIGGGRTCQQRSPAETLSRGEINGRIYGDGSVDAPCPPAPVNSCLLFAGGPVKQ